MAAEGRNCRPNPRVDIVGIARAAWQQLTSGHTHHPQAGQQASDAEVDKLICDLATIVRLAGQLMTNASLALHQADLKSAELVISRADEIKARCEDTDQRCLDLLVVRASMATDLRILVAAMHVVPAEQTASTSALRSMAVAKA